MTIDDPNEAVCLIRLCDQELERSEHQRRTKKALSVGGNAVDAPRLQLTELTGATSAHLNYQSPFRSQEFKNLHQLLTNKNIYSKRRSLQSPFPPHHIDQPHRRQLSADPDNRAVTKQCHGASAFRSAEASRIHQGPRGICQSKHPLVALSRDDCRVRSGHQRA